MTHRAKRLAPLVFTLALALPAAGCKSCGGGGGRDGGNIPGKDSGNLPGVDSGGNVVGVDSGNAIGVDSGGGAPGITCGFDGVVWACGNGIDDDGDGAIDLADGNCIGPCDDDEATFATGIPGDNMDACRQDCFFDGDSGSGNDGCLWRLECDPLSPGATAGCPYDPGAPNCDDPISKMCLNSCASICTPGCDCFGCCTVITKSGPQTIFLGSGKGCSYETPENCAPCTQMGECMCPEPPPPPDGSDAGVPPTDAGAPNGIDSGTPCTSAPCGNNQACTTSADCPTGYMCDSCGECYSPVCGATSPCTTAGFYCALQIGADTGCCVWMIP